jgi:hypothetical protein
MPRPKRFSSIKLANGCGIVRLASWKYFADYVNVRLTDNRAYVFRGHTLSSWVLRSSLDRLIGRTTSNSGPKLRSAQLESFKLATRGRRGPYPPELLTDNDWWALGQHQGLATPLLDWTESPFVALYFAFSEVSNRRSKFRVVYALHELSVTHPEQIFEGLRIKDPLEYSGATLPREIEVVRPASPENPRLVSQRALFTRVPDGMTLDSWVTRRFPGLTRRVLYRIEIPNKDRDSCLKFLNRMNINHLSLFPDLFGATIFCNTQLEIRGY